MILALTGSIGSGKSTVASMLEELAGAVVIDADSIAHQVQAPGGSAYADIVGAFGSDILDSGGAIDRRLLGARVFGDESKRRLLNSIIHPRVREEELRLLSEYRERPLVVLMVPLFFENRMEGLADKSMTVAVGEAQRKQRLYERSGMTPDEVDRRLAAQMPDAEKARLADVVIDNGGTLEQTRRQVREALGRLGIATHP